MVNEYIRIAQEEGYQAIVYGVDVKGSLLMHYARGLRPLPGIQLPGGCTKEDVQWDILQMGEGDKMNQVLVCPGQLLHHYFSGVSSSHFPLSCL